MTSPPVAANQTPTILRVNAAVFLKLDPNKPPAETELASSAWMRNQNQKPTASFTTTLSGTTYTFDAGASSDPEERTLQYDWYTAPANTGMTPPAASTLPSCSDTNPKFGTLTGWACLATTVVVQKAISGSNYVFLRVTDPGNLQAMSSFPSGGCVPATSASRQPTDCGAIP
jgi:hypothetical protein